MPPPETRLGLMGSVCVQPTTRSACAQHQCGVSAFLVNSKTLEHLPGQFTPLIVHPMRSLPVCVAVAKPRKMRRLLLVGRTTDPRSPSLAGPLSPGGRETRRVHLPGNAGLR